MPHSSTSGTRQNQPMIVMLRGVFKLNHSKNTKTQIVIGIAQDMNII